MSQRVNYIAFNNFLIRAGNIISPLKKADEQRRHQHSRRFADKFQPRASA
jgi:hypothetical protein